MKIVLQKFWATVHVIMTTYILSTKCSRRVLEKTIRCGARECTGTDGIEAEIVRDFCTEYRLQAGGGVAIAKIAL